MSRNRHRRRGATMIFCLVLLVFLASLSGIVIRTVLNDRREARTELIRQQVQLLLQDGLDRAETRRGADPAFSGETFELKSEHPATPGTFRLKSVYNEEKKIFDIEVAFLDRSGKIVVSRPLAPQHEKP